MAVKWPLPWALLPLWIEQHFKTRVVPDHLLNISVGKRTKYDLKKKCVDLQAKCSGYSKIDPVPVSAVILGSGLVINTTHYHPQPLTTTDHH